MEARAQRFRKQARAENEGRSGTRRRYSEGLRAEAVAHLRRRVKGGASVEAVASELGVSGWTLVRWSRRESVGKGPKLRRVKVVPESTEVTTKAKVTLVTPDGYRIEGLEGRDVGAILESLR